MNLDDEHQDAFQNQLWCKFHSTFMPMVIIRIGENGEVLLEAIVVVSDLIPLPHTNILTYSLK